MKSHFRLLAVAALAMSFAVFGCTAARAQSAGHDPGVALFTRQDQTPAPIQIDTSQPGKITLAAFSDSKVSLAALTYDFKDFTPRFSMALVYSKTLDSTGNQFLGTAFKYLVLQRPSYAVAIGVGVKGLNLTGGQVGRLDPGRDLVFGAGVTFKMPIGG